MRPEIDEGGIIGNDETTNAVDLDQLFNTLDPKTRKGLQETLQGFASWYAGQGKNLNETFKYLGPSLGNFTRVMQELGRDQKTFTDLVVQGARATSAIASASRRPRQPGVERQHVRTRDRRRERVVRPRARSLPASPPGGKQDVRQPARRAGRAEQADERLEAADQEPRRRTCATSRDSCGPCARRSRACACSSTTPGPHNDSADILRRFPSLEQLASKSTKNSVEALKAGQNEVEFLRPYAPDISAWLTHFAQVPAYYDANGHYARVLPIFNGFSFDPGANQLNSLSPAERRTAQLRGGNRFCPGAATQPAPDGSNPFTDDGKLTAGDCDPSQRPVGP